MKKQHFAFLFIFASFFIICPRPANSASVEGKKKAFIISHFHYDPVWTNSQAGETLRAFAIIHQQLEYAEFEPRFKFVLSEMDYLKPYWDAYPADRERILKLSREGRIEFTGGYSEPDESEVGGEALIRNFAYGKLYKESSFPTEVITAAQHDVFGHAPQLPQILRSTGHKYSIFTRGNTLDFLTEFNWLSPDGSTVLTKNIGYVGNSSIPAFSGTDRKYYDLTLNAMFMSAGDFEEPDRSLSMKLKRSKKYDIVSATSGEFFSAVEKDLNAAGKTPPSISRDQNPVFDGCYTSRIDTKLANRRIENLLADAEKFSTINSLTSGAPYPWVELDFAWRLLLFGQHHDALTGSDNENVNLDLLEGWREATVIAEKQLKHSIVSIAKKINTASSAPTGNQVVPIVIFNSMNWNRTEPSEITVNFSKPVKAFRIVDAGGAPVLFQLFGIPPKKSFASAAFIAAPLEIPSLGYKVVYAVSSEKFPDGAIPEIKKGASVENDLYRISADPARGGGLKSVYSKILKREFINTEAGVGNELFAIEENQKGSSPWSLNPTGKYWRSGDYAAESIEVESGAVCDKLVIKNKAVKVGSGGTDIEVIPAIVSEVSICDGIPGIRFATYLLDYIGHDMVFKTGFPVDAPGAVPVFDERFSSIYRDGNKKDFFMKSENKPTQLREYPMYNWFGLSPAPSITFRDKKGRPVSQYPLAVGEIVIPDADNEMMRAANTLAEAFIKNGITTTITKASNPRSEGYYNFRFSLGNESSNKFTAVLLEKTAPDIKDGMKNEIAKNGYAFLFVESPESASQSVPSSIPTLIVSAMDKVNIDKAISFLKARMTGGKDISLPETFNATSFKSMNGSFGAALINNGNPGGSVEMKSALMLSLMRSSTGSPAGAVYSSNWERENWNHVYRYEFLPYEGNWSGAGVAREGYNFNFPLISIQTDPHKGTLPGKSFSFLKIDNPDVILSALKPAGYPMATGKENGGDVNQIALRIFNPGTSDTSGRIKPDFKILGYSQADSLDRETSKSVTANDVPFDISPFKIESFLLKIEPIASSSLSTKTDPVAGAGSVPVYSRYWETNSDAAPMGFMPVSIVLEPAGMSGDGKSLRIKVYIAGNLKDTGFKGKLKFLLPPGAIVKGNTEYDLKPLEFKMFDLTVENLDPLKLPRQYITAQAEYSETVYEDVLTFSNWKVFHGDIENASGPEFDDSGWKTAPLARFWSASGREPGVSWYRKMIFIPKGLSDAQMLFERPVGSEIEVFINGESVRLERDGLSFKPLINKDFIKPGAENLIAIRYSQKGEDSSAWGLSFRGSEALFNRENARLESEIVNVKPGEKAAIQVQFINPFDMEIEGEAILISPIETWKEGGPYSMIDISPSVQNFHVGTGGISTIKFDISAPPGALPGTHIAAVKLVYKSMISYTDTVRINLK